MTFPLFALCIFFTFIQLTSQIRVINDFYRMESTLAFESLHKKLVPLLENPASFANPESLRDQLLAMQKTHNVTGMQIFDLIERIPLIPGLEPEWSTEDMKGAEESLYRLQRGEAYYVRIQRRVKKMISYIPIQTPEKNKIYIVRAIYPLASLKDALSKSAWTLTYIITFIILIGLFIGRGLARAIVQPIKTLNRATQEIVDGHLGLQVRIHTRDEIETLAHTFNRMSQTLKEMKSRAEDANPLTQLPGNQAIFHELKKRIYERHKFVLYHIDIDRFKNFNDRYGLARGDEAIKKTADLLKEAARVKGAPDDFIGHQGGDDFVIVTRPNHAKDVAEYVIHVFDHEILKSLYRKEDYDRGYTVDIDRRRLAETGEERVTQFPLIAISLAGVSNVKKDFADYFDCMGAAVTVKKEVKKIIQSAYIIQE